MNRQYNALISVFMIICILVSAIPTFAEEPNYFIYDIEDDKAIIFDYLGTEKEITIPATIDGYQVVKIQDNTFKDNENIISVSISEGISEIGASAFENCVSLSEINVPSTIKRIGEKAIYNTAYYNNKANWKIKQQQTNGTGVDIGNDKNNSGHIDFEDAIASELEYLFLGTCLIKIHVVGRYSFKPTTTVVADGAFENNEGLKEVRLGTSLVTIGDNAFKGCTGLKKIAIPQTVDYVGKGAFADCTSLESITLEKKPIKIFNTTFLNTAYYNNNENWVDNGLYLDDYLLATKENSYEIMVSDKALYIASGAFQNNDAVIPDSVIFIDKDAFENNRNPQITGNNNTYAKTYAEENGFIFINLDDLIVGDVNFDGQINEVDYAGLCQMSVGNTYTCYAVSKSGDMDRDGAVDTFDAIALDMIINGMDPSKPKGDANGDGKVDIDDYYFICQIAQLNIKVTNVFMLERADLNNDGAIDTFDMLCMDLYLNGLYEF